TFDATTEAVNGMQGPLSEIASKVSETVELLSLLNGNTFNNDVVLNVRMQGERAAIDIVTSLYGDGGGTTPTTPGPGLNDRQRTRLNFLRNLQNSGKTLTKAQVTQLNFL